MIKWIAFLTMLIDHIGALFFPSVILMRMIGRLSMPLYAYCIARGYRSCQKHGTFSSYLKRLLFFSIASQLPYYLFHPSGSLNIGFTWTLALILLYGLEAKVGWHKRIAIISFCLAMSVLCRVDYTWYGTVFPAMIYKYFLNKKEVIAFGLSLCLAAAYGNVLQIFASAAFPLLMLLRPLDHKWEFPAVFNYAVYPVHLLVLWGINALIN